MPRYDFDMFTIGAGSGGVASSRRAGSYGARVAICEDSRVGGTCVIREKFSGREFFPDIVRHECTLFVYVGELCRYLLATPPNPADTAHKLRACFGNGLRPDQQNEQANPQGYHAAGRDLA